jgi:hypothetical protein
MRVVSFIPLDFLTIRICLHIHFTTPIHLRYCVAFADHIFHLLEEDQQKKTTAKHINIMKYSTVALPFLLVYGAISQPHWQRQHQPQRYYKKQDFWVYSDVVPLPTTTTSLALVVDTVTAPIYVPPTTTVAPVRVATAPSSLAPAPSSSFS